MPAYNTPGVYIEEISGGPRPIQASSTTDTGFIGVLTLPKAFLAGKGKAANMFLPSAMEDAELAWGRAFAFRKLLPGPVEGAPADAKGKGKPAPKSSGNRFVDLVEELLPGKWSVSSPVSDAEHITITGEDGMAVRFPARRTLFSVKTKEAGGSETKVWDLSFAADDQSIMTLIGTHATPGGVGHAGGLAAVDTSKAYTVDVTGIHDRMCKTAPMLTGIDSFDSWRRDFGQELFQEVLMDAKNNTVSENQAATLWETLPASARKSWDDWLRSHPGMRRIEIGLKGFFENGGQTAFIAVAIQEAGTGGPNKRKFLVDSFDGISAVAMLAAPGLDFAWQTAILEYSGPAGRGDLFAILEAPRYYLTKAPRTRSLSPFRWCESDSPYEVGTLQTLATPQAGEQRFGGFAADELLDRAVPRDGTGYGAAYSPWLVVDNPLSSGPHDRFVIAPPSGHVAGVIAATDLKPGGGVHKAPANEQVLGCADLVTEVSDKEQGVLNVKGINIIRHRPFAGIRIWGARTIASDPLWNYVNVRRLFLMVERSVRDAIQWAVFLPNTPATRADLKSTIASFLYRLWKEGALDGETWNEAFSVQCDSNNNPDVDVRSGLLTVDVQMRPVYPAEFIRVRFRQSPMRSEVSE